MDRVKGYHSTVTVEGLQNYLSTRLPLRLNALQHFRLLRTVFFLVFASAVVIHLLGQQDKTVQGTLIHATTIGLVYVVGVGLATTLLHALRDTTQDLRVRHLWFASMAGFILGHYFLPINEYISWLLGVDANGHAGPMSFGQLLPVWFLVTYLFIQPYLNEGLKSELLRLREVNAVLESRDKSAGQNGKQLIRFSSGRTNFALQARSIRNIAVEDHYCYVHYQCDGAYEKRDLAMPLRDIQTLLPPEFVQVHRSHIVNLKCVTSVRRKNRSIRVILDGGYEVPVSRHRLDDVLPLLRKGGASAGSTGTRHKDHNA